MKVNGKKVWSVTWKTLLGIILLIAVFFGGVAFCAFFRSWEYQHRYGSQSVKEYYLRYTTSYKVQHKYDRYCRTIDAVTGKPLTPKLARIYEGQVNDTLTVYEDRKSRRGYLNIYTGEIAISAKWQHAWIFSEGLGAVVENGRMGFIDHQGNWVIRPQFYYTGWGVEYVFKNGICTVKDTCGLFGIIDREGKWVLPPQYTKVQRKEHGYRLLVTDYEKGGLADSLGNIVLPCEYDRVDVREDGIVLRKDGRQWMVSPDLKEVLHPFVIDGQSQFSVYTGVHNSEGDAYYDVYEPIGRYNIGCKYGLLDRRSGHPITPAIYAKIDLVSFTLFECKLSDDYDSPSIFINAQGKEVKP